MYTSMPQGQGGGHDGGDRGEEVGAGLATARGETETETKRERRRKSVKIKGSFSRLLFA